MLKRTVPTPTKFAVSAGGLALALIAKTSSSGSDKRTAGFQLRPMRSSQWLFAALNLTMRPVSGPVVPWKFVFGAGSPPGIVVPPTLQVGAVAPPLHTAPSFTVVVRLPEWNTAA